MNVTKDEAAPEAPTTVGGTLRAERESQGQTLEDIGRQTRVPVRHLVQIEEGRLQGLPAAPYSAGFVKSYARALGLDPVALSHAFRAEFDAANRNSPRISYEPYEPADPVRLPPRLLAIVAAVIAILLAGSYGIWRSGVLHGEGPDNRAKLAAAGDDGNSAITVPAAGAIAPTPAVAIGGAVQLAALQPVWFEVTDRGSGTRLFTGVLDSGKTYDVPATAADPVIRTGRPEAIAVSVGGKPVAALGEPARTVSNVSLKGPSLLARPQAADATAPIAAPATVTAPPPPATTGNGNTASSGTMPPAFRAAAPGSEPNA
jgi:cytoskeleton protein RodZ